MNPEIAILRMLQALEDRNIQSSTNFKNDIIKLVTSDVNNFISKFTNDITRKKLIGLKKYEKLNLTPQQNKRMEGNPLFRYEYRKTSNLRCIYMIQSENNMVVLLCAFNEDGRKEKRQRRI